MPTPMPLQLLPEHHAKVGASLGYSSKKKFFGDLSKSGMVLPAGKLGNVYYHPCGSPQGSGGKSRFLAERERIASKYRGWRPTKYLVVLPSPTAQDEADLTCMSESTSGGALLRKELRRAGIHLSDVMVTYAHRFMLPRGVTSYGVQHMKDSRPYMQRDIQHCAPDVIIALGAAAIKALYGSSAKLDNVQGNVLDYQLTTNSGKVLHECKVVPTYSHLAFIGGHANISVFRSELRRAAELGASLYRARQFEKRFFVCETVKEVSDLCDLIEDESPPWIAFDTEFGNDVAREEFTYTLSVQLSWGENTAAFIKLRGQEEVFRPEVDLPSYEEALPLIYKKPERAKGSPASYRNYAAYCKKIEASVVWRQGHEYHFEHEGRYYKGGVKIHSVEEERAIWDRLHKLLSNRKWRLSAHHLRVDADQCYRNGCDIDERIADGLDTLLMHHLLYGDEQQGLDHLVRKYAAHYGAFWLGLEEWLDNTGSRNKHLQYGYRDIPLDILIPYALSDAAVTWTATEKLLEELNEPDNKKLKRLYFRQVAPASLHLLDIEREGIIVDEDRRAELRDFYQPIHDRLLARLRERINWPGFNPGSPEQIATLLFPNVDYKRKKQAPEGARTLDLEPICNTDKYPIPWDKLKAAGEEKFASPSTAAKTLELMYNQNRDIVELRLLRNISVINKFLSSYLKPQDVNEHGVVEDGKGFHCNIHGDGRVRTHLSQITSTGRLTSSKANLQTKPKKQEAAAFAAVIDCLYEMSVEDYEEAVERGEVEKVKVNKFASCFVAPEGYALIEADFKTAEVFVWAYASGDKELIALVDNGRDIHSETAAKSFNLPELADLEFAINALANGEVEVYKAWADGIKDKYGALRIAAKTVVFGVMYGRGAPALTAEINKVVKEPITVDVAQQIIDGISKAYPDAWDWLVENSEKAVEQEFIENVFGRRRYFQGASQMSEWDQASVKREAKNSPIQGTVGDLLLKSGIMLRKALKDLEAEGNPLDMKILLPIHDAFLFEVKYEDVPRAVEVIEECMGRRNTLPGTEFSLGVDIEIMPHRWSDKAYDPHKKDEKGVSMLDKFMCDMAVAA